MTGRYYFDGCAFAGKSFAVLQKCGTVRGAEIDPQEKRKQDWSSLSEDLENRDRLKMQKVFGAFCVFFYFIAKYIL